MISAKRKTLDSDDKKEDYPSTRVKFEDGFAAYGFFPVLKNRSAMSPKDLPSDCLRDFRVTFRPAIRDFVATLKPWEPPADADIVRIWNRCFPMRQLEVSNGLYTVVAKLVDDTIQYWRRDMATTAVEWLNKDLKTLYNKQHERVSHAAQLLGDDDKDRKRPFYYKKYGNGTQPSGIFQSPIIAATLATHLSSIEHLTEESRLRAYPTGALALSVLAVRLFTFKYRLMMLRPSNRVKRALTWAKSGVETIPTTSEGHFSRANWGDHYKLQGGQYVIVQAASNIVAVIRKLHKAHWEQILAEAHKYATQKNRVAFSKVLEDVTRPV